MAVVCCISEAVGNLSNISYHVASDLLGSVGGYKEV